MSEKTNELNAAHEKLSKLINNVQSLEQQYDQALEHAANYLGNDDDIEKIRDERASAAHDSLVAAKKEAELQLKLVQELISKY